MSVHKDAHLDLHLYAHPTETLECYSIAVWVVIADCGQGWAGTSRGICKESVQLGPASSRSAAELQLIALSQLQIKALGEEK
jgi:hypothetical protein